ncbi:hypothetical protein JOC83_003017 [Bacillus iocasae]|uniref:Uncharacterized protein n=1 Tax=Priestia iocasae TaxID=2291674 RepID=A0ABS2QYU8_9BACI|nr:hypothetical protein [Metabacillus iocasae]
MRILLYGFVLVNIVGLLYWITTMVIDLFK